MPSFFAFDLILIRGYTLLNAYSAVVRENAQTDLPNLGAMNYNYIRTSNNISFVRNTADGAQATFIWRTRIYIFTITINPSKLVAITSYR